MLKTQAQVALNTLKQVAEAANKAGVLNLTDAVNSVNALNVFAHVITTLPDDKPIEQVTTSEEAKEK